MAGRRLTRATPRSRFDAAGGADHISLHGPPFGDVLRALLAVDPDELSGDEDEGNGASP